MTKQNIEELVGKKFNKLIVVGISRNNDKQICKCVCDCGNEIYVKHIYLLNNKIKSCGCVNKNKIRYSDISNQKFGMLTAIEYLYSKDNRAVWKCICECGKEKEIRGADLRSGRTKSCGNHSKKEKLSIRKDLTNQRFGKLIAIKISHIFNKKIYWECLCDCGNYKNIRGSSLCKGITKSCGCLLSENKIKPIIASAKIIFRRYNDGNLTFNDFIKLSQEICFYCGEKPSQICNATARKNSKYSLKSKNNPDYNFIYNGLDRKDSSLKHDIENIVTCCSICNKSKMDTPFDLFINKIDLIYNRFIKDKDCFEIFINNKNKILSEINYLYFNKDNILIPLIKETFQKSDKGTLGFEDFYKLSQMNCFYCDQEPSNKTKRFSKKMNKYNYFIYSGLDRINSKETYSINNVVPCCKYCNIIKLDKDIDGFFKFIEKIYLNMHK